MCHHAEGSVVTRLAGGNGVHLIVAQGLQQGRGGGVGNRGQAYTHLAGVGCKGGSIPGAGNNTYTHAVKTRWFVISVTGIVRFDGDGDKGNGKGQVGKEHAVFPAGKEKRAGQQVYLALLEQLKTARPVVAIHDLVAYSRIGRNFVQNFKDRSPVMSVPVTGHIVAELKKSHAHDLSGKSGRGQ